MSEDTGPSGPILIKKYGNRRLYDTQKSRYITLEELAETVRAGADVKVVEAKTGRDLTRPVLLQILLEQHEALDLVPVELLHLLLRVAGTLEQVPFAALLSGLTRQFAAQGQQMVAQLLGGGVPAGLAGLFPGGTLGAAWPGDSVHRGASAEPPEPESPASRGASAGSSQPEAPGGPDGRAAPGAAAPAPSPEHQEPPLDGGAAREAPSEADLAAVKARMDALLGRLQKR